jgi:putative spermidine/putrescine transport system permease protein
MREGSKDSTLAPDGTGRRGSPWRLLTLLGPALCLILLLFGGGLVLGLFQALGYLPSQGFSAISLQHFIHVLQDPDFGKSLILTLYISITSTLIAAVVSVLLALTLMRWAAESRAIHFILQIPLTVPHLVIAISVILLLAPSGLFSRLFSTLSIIESPASFPLFVNDGWGIGILCVYIWKEVPFITFMLLSVLKNMGTELTEVGATLNASRGQRFFFITLPIIAPSLGAACLIVFAFTFGAFEVPYLLGRTYPLALSVWAYKNYSDVDLLARPEGIAIGLIIAGIVILAIILSQIVLHLGRKRGLTI